MLTFFNNLVLWNASEASVSDTCFEQNSLGTIQRISSVAECEPTKETLFYADVAMKEMFPVETEAIYCVHGSNMELYKEAGCKYVYDSSGIHTDTTKTLVQNLHSFLQERFCSKHTEVLNVLYINLKTSEDRRVRFQQMVLRLNKLVSPLVFLRLHRVDAVDGTSGKLEDIPVEIVNGNPRLLSTVSTKRLGLTLSHMKAGKFAKDHGFTECIVCEDDCVLNFGWNTDYFLTCLQKARDPSFLHLWLLTPCYDRFEVYDDQPFSNNYTWCSAGYFLNTEGVERIASHVSDGKYDFSKVRAGNFAADLWIRTVAKTKTCFVPFATFSTDFKTTVQSDAQDRRIVALGQKIHKMYLERFPDCGL